MRELEVLEVYRPLQRSGPILVTNKSSERVSVGTFLVSLDDPERRVRVIAIDPPTRKSLANGRLAIVVTPDLGDALKAGARFKVVNSV